MPQGNKKNKKLVMPSAVVSKKKEKLHAVSRKNRPIAAKKAKHLEAQHLRKVITKNVNRCMEEQIRSIANDSQKVHLSKKKDKGPSSNFNANRMPPMETS